MQSFTNAELESGHAQCTRDTQARSVNSAMKIYVAVK